MSERIYRLSRAAEAELLEIWTYLYEQSQSEQSAEKVLREIAAQCSLLVDFPYMGRSREELGRGYRSFPVGRYVIFYRLIAEGIEISHVLHGAQDVTHIYFPVPEEDTEQAQ
jgi:toxin ParE1/3/4